MQLDTNLTDFGDIYLPPKVAENENLSQIPVHVLLCFIFVIGVLGNLSVCVVIAKNKDMRTASNYYLISLAISDLLLIVCGLLSWYLKILLQRNVVKGYLCVIKTVGGKTGYFATLLTIIAFSVERYIAICHPFSLYKMNKLSITIKVIVAYWIVAFCLSLPNAFYNWCYTDDTGFPPVLIAYTSYVELFYFITYFVTMTLVAVLYSLMGFRLTNSTKLSSTANTEQKKIIKLLAAVVITLLICWTPAHIYHFILFSLRKTKTFNPNAYKITRALFYMVSTTVNPFIYNVMSSKFRESFKKTFLCKIKRKQDSQPVTASVTEENVGSLNMTE